MVCENQCEQVYMPACGTTPDLQAGEEEGICRSLAFFHPIVSDWLVSGRGLAVGENPCLKALKIKKRFPFNFPRRKRSKASLLIS